MEQIFSVFQTLFDAWTAVSFVFALVGIASLIFVVVGCISGVTQATVRFGLALLTYAHHRVGSVLLHRFFKNLSCLSKHRRHFEL